MIEERNSTDCVLYNLIYSIFKILLVRFLYLHLTSQMNTNLSDTRAMNTFKKSTSL